jgi:uncharacterized protein YbjT (DUF2867 family)
MIGGIVLRECLNDTTIEQVTSIVRRPSGVSHAKLVEVVHQDFLDYRDIAAHFQNQDIAHFCIGVYTGQVSDSEFKKITFGFAKAFADALAKASPTATCCFLSGAGADQKEKSRMSFAKYKGMAENYLIQKNFGQLYIFRPAYIYPVEKRQEPNFSYRLMRSLYPLMKALYPQGAITSEQLGMAMFKAGITGADQVVLENEDIKRVLTLPH